MKYVHEMLCPRHLYPANGLQDSFLFAHYNPQGKRAVRGMEYNHPDAAFLMISRILFDLDSSVSHGRNRLIGLLRDILWSEYIDCGRSVASGAGSELDQLKYA